MWFITTEKGDRNASQRHYEQMTTENRVRTYAP